MAGPHEDQSAQARDNHQTRCRTGDHVSGASNWLYIAPASYWLCCSLMFLVQLGCAILGPSSPRLLEAATCRDYLSRHDPSKIPTTGEIPETTCKATEIHKAFTFLLSAGTALTNLAALSMQIPMGVLADKKGRRMALMLNVTSTILYWMWVFFAGYFQTIMPLWAIYLAPLFLLIGGGPWLTSSLVYASIHDLTDRQQRTMAFSIMSAIAGIADLIGPVIAALTLTHHIWLPFALATICFSLMYIPAWLIPVGTHESVVNADIDTATPEAEPLLGGSDSERRPADASTTRALLTHKFAITSTCLVSFTLITLAKDSVNFVIPWISFRFEQSMAKAGLMFSLRAIVSQFLLLILIPAASSFLSHRCRFDSSDRDLLLSQLSVAMLLLGALLSAFAPDLWMFVSGFVIGILGSGVGLTLRAFFAAAVTRQMSGRLYTLIATFQTLGGLLGMPLMGAVYSWGISHHINQVAMPWIVSSVFYILVSAGLIVYRLKMTKKSLSQNAPA